MIMIYDQKYENGSSGRQIDVTILKLSDGVRQGKSFESKTLWIPPPPSQPILTFLLSPAGN